MLILIRILNPHLTPNCASRIRGWKMMFRASKVRGMPYENHIVLLKNDSLIWKRFEVRVEPSDQRFTMINNKVMEKLRCKGLTVSSLLPPYWRCGYRRKLYPHRKGSSIPVVCNLSLVTNYFWRIIDNIIILDEKRVKFHEFHFCDKLFRSRLPN